MFKTKMLRKNFSLIELLIVIGIMGALAALILPAFSDSETAAKDTACDYNQAGTLRYLNMFYSVNGVYPSGFHTGGSTSGWAAANNDNDVVLTTCAKHNFENASDDLALTQGADSYEKSLVDAGIVELAFGQGNSAGYAKVSDGNVTVKSVKGETTSWTEELDPLTGEVNPNGAPLTFRGVSLGHIAEIGQMEEGTLATHLTGAAGDCRQFRKAGEGKFKIVPLYVAPTIDWTTYYVDGPNDSKVSVAMTSKCPWGEDGVARYYIAFFKVYEDGTPAKLLCTSCPDCGVLEGNAF